MTLVATPKDESDLFHETWLWELISKTDKPDSKSKWTKRWVILYCDRLCTFKSYKSQKRSISWYPVASIGSIDRQLPRGVEIRPYVFALNITSPRKTLYFGATTANLREVWITSIFFLQGRHATLPHPVGVHRANSAVVRSELPITTVELVESEDEESHKDSTSHNEANDNTSLPVTIISVDDASNPPSLKPALKAPGSGRRRRNDPESVRFASTSNHDDESTDGSGSTPSNVKDAASRVGIAEHELDEMRAQYRSERLGRQSRQGVESSDDDARARKISPETRRTHMRRRSLKKKGDRKKSNRGSNRLRRSSSDNSMSNETSSSGSWTFSTTNLLITSASAERFRKTVADESEQLNASSSSVPIQVGDEERRPSVWIDNNFIAMGRTEDSVDDDREGSPSPFLTERARRASARHAMLGASLSGTTGNLIFNTRRQENDILANDDDWSPSFLGGGGGGDGAGNEDAMDSNQSLENVRREKRGKKSGSETMVGSRPNRKFELRKDKKSSSHPTFRAGE